MDHEDSRGNPAPLVRVYAIKPEGYSNHIVPYTVIVHEHPGPTAQVIFGLAAVEQLKDLVSRHTPQVPRIIVAEPACLSWISLIPVPFEFTIDKSHLSFQLYEDALRHIQLEASTSSLLSVVATSRKPLPRHPTSFGTLVNLLADRYCLAFPIPVEMDVSVSPDSVLDFILFGMLYIVAMNRKTVVRNGSSFVASQCLDKGSELEPSALYRAALLDIITPLWTHECWTRLQARWSPMPWSGASLRQFDAPTGAVATTLLRAPSANVLDALQDDSPTLRFTCSAHGYPADIQWLCAPHDGYQLRTTLASYTKVRRSSMAPSLRDDVALWLSTLTFGLLEAVVSMRIPEALLLYSQRGDQQIAISGARVLRLILLWSTLMRRYPWVDDEARRRRGREVSQLIETALLAIDEEYGMTAVGLFTRAGFDEDAMKEVVGPVVLTIFTLCHQAALVWPEEFAFNRQLRRDPDRAYHLLVEGACQNGMVRAGWCPYTVSREFLALLERSQLSNIGRLPPFIRRSSGEHRTCTNRSCALYTISDTDAYGAHHTEPSCCCDHIAPLYQDIERLLSENDEGTVPVVVFDGHQLIVQRAAEHSYVAISHVWADGLGSTTETGLPACQVARLASLARSLSPNSGAFWIDSLCVPESRELRKRAIKLMARTYEDAASVLVIDACIRSQCAQTKPWQENLFRMATSGWVRRVWTLQEGLLARRLYFEFADGPVDVEEALERLNRRADIIQPAWSRSSPPSELVSSRLCHAYLPLIAFRAENAGGSGPSCRCTLDDVIRLLRLRTTTKAEDETIAISSLLPIDVSALLSLTGLNAVDLRMRAFLLQLREVPRRFPILAGSKVHLRNFRWAPRSLSAAFNDNSREFGIARCTEEGLFGEYDIVRLQSAVQVPSSCLSGLEEELPIFIADDASNSVYAAQIQFPRSAEDGSEADHGECATSTALPSAIDALLFISDGSLENKFTACAAVLRLGHAIEVRDENGAEESASRPLHCEHVATGFFFRIPPSPAEFEEGYKRSYHYVRGVFGRVHVRLT